MEATVYLCLARKGYGLICAGNARLLRIQKEAPRMRGIDLKSHLSNFLRRDF